jgi:hypothetical protein
MHSRCSSRQEADNIGFQSLDDQLYDPFDVVYTWVNGSDPVWKAKKELWSSAIRNEIAETLSANSSWEHPGSDLNTTNTNTTANVTGGMNETAAEADETMSQNRYRDSEELRFSLRSLVKNAPWVRHIYLVTDNQIPYWLNLESTKLTVVSHEQIFANKSHLPVFSSPAIEANLHRIPGLSKKFIYFNDDVFLGMKVFPEDFISLRGAQRLVMSWDVPKCAPGCSDTWIGDGFCDKACNVSACNFDFPDCINGTNANTHGNQGGNYRSSATTAMCMKGCPDNWLGDKICDHRCKSEECGWDVGDCGLDLVTSSYAGVAIDRTTARIFPTPDATESFSYGMGDYTYGSPDTFAGSEGNLLDELSGAEEAITAASIAGLDSENGDGDSPAVASNATNAVPDANSINSTSIKVPVVTRQTPALTVEYGTKAVYFDLAPLACMHCSNATCEPERLTGILYERAEHDDDDGKIVHSASILSRHHVLVVLFYYGQEGAPEPSWDFFDVKFTVVALNTVNTASNTAVFTLRMVPPAPAEQKHPGDLVPPGMGLLLQPLAHACAPEELPGESNTTVSIELGDVTVLPHPYQIGVGKEDAQEEGVIIAARVHIPSSPEPRNTPLVVVYTVTDAAGTARQATMPLCDALLSFSETPRPGFRSLADAGETGFGGCVTTLENLVREAERGAQPYDARVAGRGSSRPPRFLALNSPTSSVLPAGYGSTDHITNDTAAAPSVAVPAGKKVLFKLPMPVRWTVVTSAAWFHALVEIRPAHSRDDGAEAHSGEFQVAPPRRSQSPALACFSAAIQWGSESKKNSSLSEAHTSETSQTAQNSTSPLPVSGNHTSVLVSGNLTTPTTGTPAQEAGAEARRRLSAGHESRVSIMASIASFVQAGLDWLHLSDFSSHSGEDSEDQRKARRRLEDTYGASLVHVNRIYNKEFGAEGRKVPAHVPHMIDRDYMDEMQARWADQWAATSSHRFRSSTDMQYSFSYYYYLMNRHKIHPHDLHKYLSMVVDTDRDGHLDENEFRSVATMVKSSASPTAEDLRRMRECISNSSAYRPVHREEMLHAVPRGTVRKSFVLEVHPTIEQVLNCTEVTDGLRKYINWNNIFPSHVQESDKDLVAFEMIGDNYTIALSQLDSVRARQSKFICINDNMKNPTPELEKALRRFYESFFPEPCVFELPPGTSNPTLYLDKYQELRRLRSSGMGLLLDMLRTAYETTVAWGWKMTRNALLSVAHETIDAVSDYDTDSADEGLVYGLRNEIRREPRRQYSGHRRNEEVGLGRTVFFLSVLGVVGIVLLRIVGKSRRN